MAAPLAAKAAADGEIAKLTGVVLDGAAAPSANYAASLGVPISNGADDWAKAKMAASNYTKLVGIPDFVKEQLRRQAQWVDRLDPDIASKRSWSMAVKIMTQRQRNFERQVEQLHYSSWATHSSLAFKKLTGWDWPW